MPDLDVVRNREIARIAGALERQNKLIEQQTKVHKELGQHLVNTLQALDKFFALLTVDQDEVSTGLLPDEPSMTIVNSNDIDPHMNCTPSVCFVAHVDPNFDYEDCPKKENVDAP